MDNEKMIIAYHETCHAVMALICRLKIKRVSIKGNDIYGGVMSTDPTEREITNPNEAIREVRISLSGFIGEVLYSGQYSVFRGHPDLVSAIELVEEILAYDVEFRRRVEGLKSHNSLPFIENPLVETFIEGKLSWCHKTLQPHRPVIQAIAEELYMKEELTGDEIFAFFNSFVKSSSAGD